MLQITSGPALLQPWCQTRGRAELISLLGCCCCWGCYSTSEKWEMQRWKAALRAVLWGFNLITWAGDPCVCCPHQLSVPTLCLKEPNSLAAPGSPSAAAATASPSSSSWAVLEQPRIKEQHLGCPGQLGLRNAVVLGWRMINSLLFLQRTMGVWDSFSFSVWLWT